ncbi:hypothetical protein [Sphingomonas hylomeconis]|uniref:Uncharacterized protein n=1 Tax=Sphingomonas hylomeconis TaxID=1395958 RepID=A0ABV7SXT0_9SPHN|nr:hypothetical protein [Sphingomonas hylomeconis]
MVQRFHERTIDLSIRAAGMLGCTLSYLAVGALAQLRLPAPAAPPAIAYALAAAAFLFASVGSTLVMLGRHIFDRVAISGRWQRRPGSYSPRTGTAAAAHDDGRRVAGDSPYQAAAASWLRPATARASSTGRGRPK